MAETIIPASEFFESGTASPARYVFLVWADVPVLNSAESQRDWVCRLRLHINGHRLD